MNNINQITLISGSESPSTEAMNRTYRRTVLNGGITQDFSANIDNIRDMSRNLNYNIFNDATFVYVPSSYGESKNFSQSHDIRNLLRFSEDFTQSIWVRSNTTVIPNTNLNPFGENKSYYINEGSGATGSRSITQANSVFSSNTYSISWYIKKADNTWIQLAGGGAFGNSAWRNFNFDTGLFGNGGSLGIWSLSALTNGYWLINFIGKPIINGSDNTATIFGNNNIDSVNRGPSYSGSDRNIVDIAAIQFETSYTGTKYQRTTDTIVDFNFTRATSTRVTNKNGVIEDSCYNLIQRSEEFENAYWSKLNTTVSANVILAPNGTLTADKLIDNTTNGLHETFVATGVPLIMQTQSIWMKSAGRNWGQLALGNSNGAYFDLINGVIGTISSATTASMIPYPNGWYLCSVSAIPNNTNFNILIANGDLINNFIGDGVSGIYIWGAQLTIGSTPRPYLKTTNRLNIPRLDYSRGLGEPELLIERQSTNLLIQSEDFVNGAWLKNNVTASLNTNSNPFGTNKSYYIQETSGNTAHYAEHSITTVAGSVYTASWYVKKADDTWIVLHPGGTAFGSAFTNFNFDTGEFGIKGGIGIWYKKQLTNGYWLLYVTATANATSTNGMHIAGTNNTNSAIAIPAYTGTTGHRIVDIAGAQLELGTNVTTYIPTTTATVTRNGETNFVDLWNNNLLNKTNWSLFWEGYLYDGKTTGLPLSLSDTPNPSIISNQIGWFTKVRPFYGISGSSFSFSDGTTNNTFNKFGIIYSAGTANFYINGLNIFSNKQIPVIDYRYLVLGSAAGANNTTFSTNKIALFNRTLSDSEITNLTYINPINTQLLDSYTGSSIALSLRKLSTNYSGNCLRVRRDSDNTEQDIGFNNNVLDVNTLRSFVGSGDGFVSIWYDQSGNNRDAFQITEAYQPRIILSGSVSNVNGRYAIYWGLTGIKYLDVPVLSLSFTLASVFGVENKDTSDNNQRLISFFPTGGNDQSNNAKAFAFGGRQIFSTFRGINTTASPPTLVTILSTNIITNSNATIYTNNILSIQDTSIINTLCATDQIQIGNEGNGDLSARFFRGYKHELIFYPFDNSINRNAIENEINQYYKMY